MLKDAPQKIAFSGDWAAVECRGWHRHVKLANVALVRFVEESSQDGSVSPVALFEDKGGTSVMRFYFPHATVIRTPHTQRRNWRCSIDSGNDTERN